MAKRKKSAPAALNHKRPKFRPQARMGANLRELLEERAASPHGEYSDVMRRPVNARLEAFQARDDSVAEIDLYDVIGTWETNAATFRATLKEITAPRIVLNINSPGGSVFDGFTMFSNLREHPAHVTVRVQGLAASAASVVAMAGDRIEIAENGFLMIHNAWALEIGDKRAMEKMARVLGQIDTRIAKTYANRSGADLEEIVAWMDDETWMDSEDAIDRGFADVIADAVDAENLAHDVSKFAKAPREIRTAATREPRPAPAAAPVAQDEAPDLSGIAAEIQALARVIAGGR